MQYRWLYFPELGLNSRFTTFERDTLTMTIVENGLVLWIFDVVFSFLVGVSGYPTELPEVTKNVPLHSVEI